MAYVPLEDVKSYCRIDGTDEDGLVAALIDAAEDYLSGAGVTPEGAPVSLYQLAVQGIVLHWYDNRAAVDGSRPTDFEPGIRTVINQLKHRCAIVSNLDTSCGGR